MDRPEPPYYAVILTSTRSDEDHHGYARASERMVELGSEQPGFLGIDSVRDANGLGITVSYWRDEESIAAWRRNAEHTQARESGRKHWYDSYEVTVAKVERAYGYRRAEDAGSAGSREAIAPGAESA